MKKIFLAAIMLLSVFSCDRLPQQQVAMANTNEQLLPVPADIFTNGELSWVASPVSATGYVAVQPQQLFDNGSIGDTKIIKARLHKDSSFQFTLYKKATANKNAAWITITGTFELEKSTKGRSILTTRAIKGFYGSRENGQDKVIDQNTLATDYSSSYLCEKIHFNDMSSADFLLLVNIDEHPGIEKNTAVQLSWVSKFYLK